MPVSRGRQTLSEVVNVRVQDFILKTHIDYLDEHFKSDMKRQSDESVSSLRDNEDAEQENEEPLHSTSADDHLPADESSETIPSRTKYSRSTKPRGPGALKEKEVELVIMKSVTSLSEDVTPVVPPVKDQSKARVRYRGYNFHGLALNCIDTEDVQYRKMLASAMKYPSYFQPFSAVDLMYRNPPDNAKFSSVPHVQLLLGQKSSVTKFHQETVNSHGLLVLLSGTKRWFFRYPEDGGK
jgi:hypothetical protein